MGGLIGLFTLAVLPTGFLRGMTVGGLLTLANGGSAGRGASITLVVISDGIKCPMLSLGGRAGRVGEKSFLMRGRTTWVRCEKFPGGGAGRAFEKRERPPTRDMARESVSISHCTRRWPPFFQTLQRLAGRGKVAGAESFVQCHLTQGLDSITSRRLMGRNIVRNAVGVTGRVEGPGTMPRISNTG